MHSNYFRKQKRYFIKIPNVGFSLNRNKMEWVLINSFLDHESFIDLNFVVDFYGNYMRDAFICKFNMEYWMISIYKTILDLCNEN